MWQRLQRRLNLQPAYQTAQKISYAQCGEDLIVEYLLNTLGIPAPTYLDIGANHPFYLSNTFLFYQKGCQGVCVEPDPHLCELHAQHRPKDRCLNFGVSGTESGTFDFYVMDSKFLSTFSKKVVDDLIQTGKHRVIEKRSIQLKPINQLLAENFQPCPDFVSLDTEGNDEEILAQWDFEKFRPKVFCIETAVYVNDAKLDTIKQRVLAQGYRIYADNFINTIFVDALVWSTLRNTH